MKKENLGRIRKMEFSDPVYYYILAVAGIVFLYTAFPSITQILYENLIGIPCFLFLGLMLERKTQVRNKGLFFLAGFMAVWFVILQARRFIYGEDIYSFQPFLTVYLFAFPLASLVKDGDKKTGLKIFAAAYLAAAAFLAAYSVLLLADRLPAKLLYYVFWNGARLEVFWHPNIAGCFFMIGIVFCTTFLSQAKPLLLRLALAILLVVMAGALALTSCRTAIILTGGYLGALVFFMLIKRGRKWIVPGILAVILITVGFYVGSGRIYQANNAMLIEKYAQEHSGQPASEPADPVPTDPAPTEPAVQENAETETADTGAEQPAAVNNPGMGKNSMETNSPQGSILSDMGTLNSRTLIWDTALNAIFESPSVLVWGTDDPGEYIAERSPFQVAHAHNAWLECLMGMGIAGFLIAVLFTLVTAWNILLVFLKHPQDLWKRNIALLTMCIMIVSLLEPYLFYTMPSHHPVDFLFFLCAGYLLHWREADKIRT